MRFTFRCLVLARVGRECLVRIREHLRHLAPFPPSLDLSNTQPHPVQLTNTSPDIYDIHRIVSKDRIVAMLAREVRDAGLNDERMSEFTQCLRLWQGRFGKHTLRGREDSQCYTCPALIVTLPELKRKANGMDAELLLRELQLVTREGCAKGEIAVRHDVLFAKVSSEQESTPMKWSGLFELRRVRR